MLVIIRVFPFVLSCRLSITSINVNAGTVLTANICCWTSAVFPEVVPTNEISEYQDYCIETLYSIGPSYENQLLQEKSYSQCLLTVLVYSILISAENLGKLLRVQIFLAATSAKVHLYLPRFLRILLFACGMWSTWNTFRTIHSYSSMSASLKRVFCQFFLFFGIWLSS